MYSFIVKEDHLDSAFASLSKQLPASIIGDTFQIPRHRGRGLIKGILLEEGLYLRYTRISYSEDSEIIRLAKQPDGEMIFSLGFLLTPAAIKWIKPLSRTTLPTTPTHSIELLFSRKWMQAHLASMDKKIQIMEASLAEETSPLLSGITLPSDDRLLGEIVSELHTPVNLLNIRAKALLLVAGTIERLAGRPASPSPVRKNWHIQTIHRVEQRLLQCLEDMLPPQKELAREFALSESTLKRHFKAVYGKTMYEYYLEKKMDLAKWLLVEKKISVSETAYMLGYEKVSAFIIIFKKHHKVLPGSLK